MEDLLSECCETLILQSSSSVSPSQQQWQQALQQVEAAVNAVGPRRSSPILLKFLRRPGLPDCVLDCLCHSIARCCGSCAAPPSTLTFTFSPFLSVNIKEMDYVKGGLGWKVWGSALMLAWQILCLQKDFQNKRVLELGSGCGLCGLLVAKLGASEVILTDYVPEILTNLCDNALLLPANAFGPEDDSQCMQKMKKTEAVYDFAYEEANRSPPNKQPCTIRVRVLDWAEDSTSSYTNNESNLLDWPKLGGHEKFDWVIGSDLIYNNDSIKSLVGVVKRRLVTTGGKGLFAVPVREIHEFNLFLSELDVYGMEANVHKCSQDEWETCTKTLGVEEGGTLHGVDHYEGGLVIIDVTHRP